jgi:hypothetical protein
MFTPGNGMTIHKSNMFHGVETANQCGFGRFKTSQSRPSKDEDTAKAQATCRGFLKSRYPKIDSLYWKIIRKWMIARGNPLFGNLHVGSCRIM